MIEIAYDSDIGRVRDMDEDGIAVVRIDTLYSSKRNETVLLVLADGMGGHNAGEIASYLGTRTVAEYIVSRSLASNDITDYRTLLKSAISEANTAILNYAIKNPECSGMGTTVVSAIVEDKKNFAKSKIFVPNQKVILSDSGKNLYVGNVGDSRLYIITGEGIRQVTVDHTLGGGVLTRVVGYSPVLEVDTFEIKLMEGDIILICCDGLTDVVGENEIMETVLKNNPNDACNKLIELANEMGGPDNISVIIAKI